MWTASSTRIDAPAASLARGMLFLSDINEMRGERMEVSVENPGGLERRMRVHVPSQRVEDAVAEKIKRVGRHAKVPGFRPGKVPIKVLYQRYGQQARQEVLSELLPSTCSEALGQAELSPAGQPQIELQQQGPGEDLEYIATFEVYPQIELKSLEGQAVEEPETSVEDADVDNTIERIRKQHQTFEGTERAAEEGDRVTIDFEGRIDGEPFEGNSGEDVPVEIGSGRFLNEMENGLKAHTTGESFTVEVNFPDDYPSQPLQGQRAEFQVTVKKVEAPQLPAIDEEFLKKLGVEEGGEEALRQKVRESLESERDKAARNRVKQQVLDALHDTNPVEVPKALVEQEIERLRGEASQRLPEGQRDPERLRELMPDNLFEETAKRRVKLGLLIAEVIKAREIELDAARVDSMLNELASGYGEPEQVIQYYRSNPQLMQGVEAMAMEEQVVDTLLQDVERKSVQMSFDELMKPASEAESS